MIKIHRSSAIIIEQQNTEPMAGNTIEMLNNSGVELIPGDVVVMDASLEFAVKTTTTSYMETLILVAVEQALPGAMVKCQYANIANVKMNINAVNIGEFIYTSSTAKSGMASSSGYPGVFGIALTSKPYGSEGLVQAILSGGVPEIF